MLCTRYPLWTCFALQTSVVSLCHWYENDVVWCYNHYFFYQCVFMLNMQHYYERKTMQFMFNNGILISGIMCGFYVTVLAFMDIHYNAYFVIRQTFWRASILCRTLSILMAFSLSMSTITTAIFHQFAYLAVSDVLLASNVSQGSIRHVYFVTIY